MNVEAFFQMIAIGLIIVDSGAALVTKDNMDKFK